jgi:hypothetical protein
MSVEREKLPAIVGTTVPVSGATLHSALAVPSIVANAGDLDRERQHAHGLLPGRLLVFRLARRARHRRAG